MEITIIAYCKVGASPQRSTKMSFPFTVNRNLQDTRYCGNIFQNLLVFVDEWISEILK